MHMRSSGDTVTVTCGMIQIITVILCTTVLPGVLGDRVGGESTMLDMKIINGVEEEREQLLRYDDAMHGMAIWQRQA